MKIPAIIILAATLFLLSGCATSHEKQILGKWESTSVSGAGNIATEYFENGTFIDTGNHELEMKGTWEILDDGKLKVEYTDPTNSISVISAYSIDGGTMTRHFEFKRVD